jgi:hypothetical protein
MPEKVANKTPFSADLVIRREHHTETFEGTSGYSKEVPVEGGVLLNIKLAANDLPSLIKKIEGHVALVE